MSGTHDVWAVQRGASDKGFWSIIGTGWQHEDGLGMSLKLNPLPIAGKHVVIRRVNRRQPQTRSMTFRYDAATSEQRPPSVALFLTRGAGDFLPCEIAVTRTVARLNHIQVRNVPTLGCH
jgi:hypothetical protein